MREEILINVTPQETRVATLENGMLQEVYIERHKNKGIVGNVYLGKVVRVLPGMQAAFVDIGLERTAFLHARDLDASRRPNGNGYQQAEPETPISSLLHEGQKITVQVVKDPIGSKGARLTGQISIPSRTLVYLPGSDYLGVSQRIQEAESRDQLLDTVTSLREEKQISGGFIVRTAAENSSVDDLRSDLDYLLATWASVRSRQASGSAPSLIHKDLSLAMRTIRDLAWESVENVRIDSNETWQQIVEFASELIPGAVDRIEHYPGERPIFDLYSVEDEIHKALQQSVPLKSGGHMVFDQTEAMTTIDINTGSFVGKRNLEETIFKTNLEAAAAMARQLRVRNIGGIIIVDFIDMALEEHRQQVMRTLERELERDSTKTQVNEMSSLGLVEITRKRTSESLERLLTEPCPACQGRGIQKTAETTCFEIFREILREARQFDAEKYLVVTSQTVIDLLLEDESTSLADLQEFISKRIELQVDPSYQQEQFDVVPM